VRACLLMRHFDRHVPPVMGLRDGFIALFLHRLAPLDGIEVRLGAVFEDVCRCGET
jgi:hypothetical protein